jgi:MerR family transcriptional regulator, thiopeptide resistance regulator
VSWSIAELARLSGVTARTLRHYDAVGLLAPAYTGANGYRFYEQEQLLRLQEILLLRDMGMPLPAIAGVLDGEHDRVEALRRHHERLVAERGRLDRLVRTVATTLAKLEGGGAMDAEEMFDGFRFTPEKMERIRAESLAWDDARARPYLDEVAQKMSEWSEDEIHAAERDAAELEKRLLALMRAGAAVDDPEVFAVLDEDIAMQRRAWTPDKQTYADLGRAFAKSPELREHLDRRDPRLADFMRDAMIAYAAARL